jgi:hypothetical protein
MTVPPQPPSATRTWRFFTVQDVRVMLIAVGILTMCIGGIVLHRDIPPGQYPAILTWLVIVLIAHDVVIAGVVFAVAFAGRRVEGRLSHRSVLIAQGALAVGGIMALLVVPEIVKKSAGTANPSILPLEYGLHLAILWAALGLAALSAILLYAALDRRRAA